MTVANTLKTQKFVLLSTAGTPAYQDVGGSTNGVADTVANGKLVAGSVVQDMGRKYSTANKVYQKVKYTNSAGAYNTFYIDVTGPSSNWASLNA